MDFANVNERAENRFAALRTSSVFLPVFLLICLLPFGVAWASLKALLTLVLNNETFSQIPLIPAVSIFLIYAIRDKIFSCDSSGGVCGAPLMIPELVCGAAVRLEMWPLSVGTEDALILIGARPF